MAVRCFVIALAALLALPGCAARHPASETAARPNIVVIVADDLGFSDLGAFGGEIDTPNLDALAFAGARLVDFNAAPSCSPTRAMLFSGTDNHTAGVGAMAEAPIPERGWGYEGVLTARVATLAERLREGGYFTTMAGKWHLGMAPEQDPYARGFNSSFALLQGAHNHFGDGGFGPADGPRQTGATYTQDGVEIAIPADFYSSDYFTTRLIAQLETAPADRPIFAYLAFTAPHSPLQAPADLIAKYRGRYDGGWASLRERRLGRLRELGLIEVDSEAHPLVPDANAWARLSRQERRETARRMETYAAMVDRLDQNVGRLVAYLRQSERYDNTVFVFLSDNGPAGETAATFSMLPGVVAHINSADNTLSEIGSSDSFAFYGPYWAQAASAPFRRHKAFMTEGGIRVPAFITYPRLPRQHVISRAHASVMDIAPTLLDLAGLVAAETVGGRAIAPMRGRSMAPYLRGETDTVHAENETISFELHGQRAVRQGDWKLLRMSAPYGDDRWALYNLAEDPAELHDVGDAHPERRQAMIAAWDAFAAEARIRAAP